MLGESRRSVFKHHMFMRCMHCMRGFIIAGSNLSLANLIHIYTYIYTYTPFPPSFPPSSFNTQPPPQSHQDPSTRPRPPSVR